MGLENFALVDTHNLPIKHQGEVHNGKVRSVYWLSKSDSAELIDRRDYEINPNSRIGVMVISDKISAFDCNWKGEEGLQGVPGKGAALNAISQHWFNLFDKNNLAGNHILETPHPLVWIVQRAKPIMVEAIARQYITGSMWRDYEKGVRNFCGNQLPDELKENQKLPELLINPTTKGIMRGIQGILEEEDTNISRDQIEKNYAKFGFRSLEDIRNYEKLLRDGFEVIDSKLSALGQLFVDSKFELGYVFSTDGRQRQMIYMDEAGTPDSSRIWDAEKYTQGIVVENSKEPFRQFLLRQKDKKDILLDKKRMPERKALAESYKVPVDEMMKIAENYVAITEKITGEPFPDIINPKQEIMDALSQLELAA